MTKCCYMFELGAVKRCVDLVELEKCWPLRRVRDRSAEEVPAEVQRAKRRGEAPSFLPRQTAMHAISKAVFSPSFYKQRDSKLL